LKGSIAEATLSNELDLDASDVVTAGVDGIHLDADNHARLAAAVQARLEVMLT